MTDILVIGDSHASPHVSNERYKALARFIVDRKPDVIVDIGDFADVGSLSTHEVNTLKGEGRDFMSDLYASKQARQWLTEPINDEVAKLTRNHKKRWKPRLIAVLGNHEGRIPRYINNRPELRQAFFEMGKEWDDLGLYYDWMESYGLTGADAEQVLQSDISDALYHGWEVYPMYTSENKHVPVVEDVYFIHYYPNDNGKPMGGLNAPRRILQAEGESVVFGHSHKWLLQEMSSKLSHKKFALNCGCFMGHHESYAGLSNQNWDRCITILKDVRNGYPHGGIEKVSYEEIMKYAV